jgi:monoamine oxidase
VEEGTDIVYQAVIIGAGWAGLGAANALRDLKNGTFLVLEGRDYVGGRSRTVRFSSTGARVELGSGWIHGATDENPIFEIAESSGMGALPSPEGYRIWSDSYQDDLPHPVSLDDVEPVIETVTGGFAEFLDNYPEDDPEDVPLRDAADEYVQEEGIAGDTELVFEFALDSEIVAEYAASLEDLSRWWWNEDGGKPGDDAVVGNGGYSGAIDWYAQGILDRIVLNANVTAIDWSDSLAVSVTYTQGGVERTANADNVIVTLPLGVLKRGTVSFIPELPREKQDAINRLEMGLLNKCIMQWDSDDNLPWPGDIGWFQKIAPLGEQGKWTEFFSLQWESGQKIVIAWSAGREAVRVEQLSDDEIKEEVMASFASMFGEGVVPTPKDWIISRWLMDPWSRGSYSYYGAFSLCIMQM